MAAILLTTLNARYPQSSFGLRYLKANLGPFEEQCVLKEFTINQRPADIAEQILAASPTVVGFGIYIWNHQQTCEVIQLVKKIKPEIILIAGGPEISYESESSPAYELLDFIIRGEADHALPALLHQIIKQALSQESQPA